MRSICIYHEKKNADPEIPILKQAKAEYAKLAVRPRHGQSASCPRYRKRYPGFSGT
jgi:hypothetical protein